MAIKAIKYFNNLIPSQQQNLNNNNFENLKEEIKLEFFLQNVKGT